MSDPFLDRIQRAADARKRVAKLMALANRHPDTPEGQSALRKAQELSRKLNIDPEDVPRLKPTNASTLAAFRGLTESLKRAFPGKIDDSDLVKRRRVVDKEEDSDGEQY